MEQHGVVILVEMYILDQFGVFSGNLDANGINGNGDANINHFTVHL